MYTCEVQNEFGESYSSGYVTVLLEPPAKPDVVKSQ